MGESGTYSAMFMSQEPNLLPIPTGVASLQALPICSLQHYPPNLLKKWGVGQLSPWVEASSTGGRRYWGEAVTEEEQEAKGHASVQSNFTKNAGGTEIPV